MHITTNSCVTAQFVSIIIPIPQPFLFKLQILDYGSTNIPGAMVTKFSMGAPNVSESTVCNLLYVTLQVPRFMR